MYDHQSESLWSQIAMKAVTGKSLGRRLKPIFLEHKTWGAWRKHHPTSLVLSRKTGYTRNYDRDPYQEYAQINQLLFPPTRHDDRFSPKEWGLGAEVNRQFKAYAFSTLEELGQVFSDSIYGQNYVICWDKHTRSAKVIDQRGDPFPSLTAYWFAWYAFHPNTEISRIDRNQAESKWESLSAICWERYCSGRKVSIYTINFLF